MEQGRKLVACRLHSYCTSLLQAFSSALDSKRYGQRNRNNVINLILLIYMSSIIATMLQDHVKKKTYFSLEWILKLLFLQRACSVQQWPRPKQTADGSPSCQVSALVKILTPLATFL